MIWGLFSIFELSLLSIIWVFCFGVTFGEVQNLHIIKPNVTFWDYFGVIILAIIMAPLTAGITIGHWITKDKTEDGN